MTLETVSASKCFGGTQYVYAHEARGDAARTRCRMQFSAFVPPQAGDGQVPVLTYLSGLTCTCTEENFTVKAAVQRHAAEHGLLIVAPDTSPRGEAVPDDEAWDLGTGAGFYVNATQNPWAGHYRMYDYVVEELPDVVGANLPADMGRRGLFGHSMGGHGTLIVALRNPDHYRSVSVLAPICAPTQTGLGEKIFGAYLGPDRAAWRDYDATELVRAGNTCSPILIDQGDEDEFFKTGAMKIDAFQAACAASGQPVTLRMQQGYDHGYFFVQTFMGDHVAYHAGVLNG